jgi:hypothetical protein
MRIVCVVLIFASLTVAGPSWTELAGAAPAGPGALKPQTEAPLNRDAKTDAQTRRRHGTVRLSGCAFKRPQRHG